uniref:Secreted protein n=1 Tax=Phytophthora fragariae TaxID=53985 RepID=A0A6A3DME8_9STRA|nr:hypothetical protein PF009_g27250 [Phytophthora fragariae]
MLTRLCRPTCCRLSLCWCWCWEYCQGTCGVPPSSLPRMGLRSRRSATSSMPFSVTRAGPRSWLWPAERRSTMSTLRLPRQVCRLWASERP